MGKKGKTGKSRLDKYYHLAKEQGYRARSAFKLIQITQKNDIFSRCRCLLDLCAAPGGWLQVAQKNMPLASTIVGVDLAPIKSIRGVTTIQADITTQRCRNVLKQHIPINTCDVVLHDGAPNVGVSWVHDAYAQNELVLHATKLACEFLTTGGTYITKVFRSQDYASLLWVFQQLFEKTIVTKPLSSRNVSAEIFIICQGYKNPQKIDPKFFDPKFVFINTEPEAQQEFHLTTDGSKGNDPKRGLSELVKAMNKKNRSGYSDGDDYRVASVSNFFHLEPKHQTPAEFITSHHKISFPDDDSLAQKIKSDSSTTAVVLQYCEDLKVLGKREYSALIKWRFKLLKKWANEKKESKNSTKEKQIEEVDSENEKIAWERELVELSVKAKKAELDEKRKLRDRFKKLKLQREMSLGVFDNEQYDPELFNLKGKEALEKEDEILESSGALVALAEVPSNDELDESSTAEDSETSDDNLTDREEESDSDSGALDPKSRLAVDLEVQAEMEKDRLGAKLAKKEMKMKKETRRQQVFSEWSREIDALSIKLTAENSEIKAHQTANEIDESDNDSLPIADEYRLMEDEDVVSMDDNHDNDESRELSNSSSTTVALNENGLAIKTVANSKGQEVVNRNLINRWFDQEMFKAVGVSLEDLEREDGMQSGKYDREINKYGSAYIQDDSNSVRGGDDEEKNAYSDSESTRESAGHGLNEGEFPQMPLTEKQKRKEKRRRELEKKEAREQRKRAKTKIGPLGVPVGTEDDKEGFEEVPIDYSVQPAAFGDAKEDEESAEYRPKTSEELAEVQAIGSLLCKKKTRMDLIDGAYNRYAFNDDDECLPEWFKEEEELFNKPDLPITKELMRQYKAKIKEISERPIRKVLEATGRRKMRLKKRLEKVKKQAESIAESSEHSELSKTKSIRKLISKARRSELPREKTYVVARKQGGTVQAGKSGGHVKMVDKRLKADKRGKRAAEKRHKKRH